MEKDRYNFNDEEFKELRDLLGNINKVKAPSNFEFNLMTKIRNQNFELSSPEKKSFALYWKIIPASAVAVVAVILFFIVGSQTGDLSNPLSIIPERAESEFVNRSESVEYKGYSAAEKKESPEVVLKSSASEIKTEAPESEESYTVTLQPNDVVKKEKINLPFDNSKSVDLDNVVANGKLSTSQNTNATLVSGGSRQVFEFNGFYIRSQEDQRTLQILRAKRDSIWRSRMGKKNKEK